MKEIFSYIVIACVFLGAMIPLTALLIHTIRENRRLDREEALKQSNRS